jgi:hypothetical protein
MLQTWTKLHFDPSDILLEETTQSAVSLNTVRLVLQDRDAVLLCNREREREGNPEDELMRHGALNWITVDLHSLDSRAACSGARRAAKPTPL